MNERNFGTYEEPRTQSSFAESNRRFRAEPKSNRLGKLFGENQAPSTMTAVPSAGGVVIYSPSTYEDVQLLIDHLKRREQVIVDFSTINQTSVYRILDFMSGAIYALGGSIQQITKNIFLFAPNGVTISVPPQLGRK